MSTLEESPFPRNTAPELPWVLGPDTSDMEPPSSFSQNGPPALASEWLKSVLVSFQRQNTCARGLSCQEKGRCHACLSPEGVWLWGVSLENSRIPQDHQAGEHTVSQGADFWLCGWKAHKFMLPEGEKVREGVPTRIPFAFSVQNVCSKHWLKRGYVIGGANVGLALLMTFRLNDRGVS